MTLRVLRAAGSTCSFGLASVLALASTACKPKATASECEQLLDRYARLVVTEKHPDASADEVALEQRREKDEARGDDTLKNCSSEVSRDELRCAMQAPTADALEKCLE
ncbi:MAG: hypothetical protein FWD17_10340 [Polyangiaceae bacterium]|nr:hypothetical protein [Polyangiaceae bacterium]